MKAFAEFKEMSMEFWSLVKLVSEALGYKDRRTGNVLAYETEDIEQVFRRFDMPLDHSVIKDVRDYSVRRAATLNRYVKNSLMDAQEAYHIFECLYNTYSDYELLCKIPKNKQSGEMKRINYFTAIINILTEITIRKQYFYDGSLGFDDDPQGLVCVFDSDNRIVGTSSRRFDGAYPQIFNPQIVWEIKEYYYTTTFGSRIADGVYETQLDGYEFADIERRTNRKVYHVFFVDGYTTWWKMGTSYLCRIIDMLNAGLVDEVIFGREVFERWPIFLEEHI